MANPATPLTADFETPYAIGSDIFTAAELDAIVKVGETLPQVEGKLGAVDEAKTDDSVRRSIISWWPDSEKWLYDRMYSAAQELNRQFFQFRLGNPEKMQYARYYGAGQGGH